MVVLDQHHTDRFAVWNGDSCQVLPSLPEKSMGIVLESPPFGGKKGGLYQYSSRPEDLSNCTSYSQFLDHYNYIVEQHARLLKPGRHACIHCMDVAQDGRMTDLPGDIIRMYEKHGFTYHDRKTIWKEPLRVAIRTRSLALRHGQIVKDSIICRSASPDYVIVMANRGTNPEPIEHPLGLTRYAGETDDKKREQNGQSPFPHELARKFKDWQDPKTNKFAHWIWQHYASAVWMDTRIGNVLPYREARESKEEKHCHPTQLDTLERCLQLWSNPGDRVLTSFMGVGSEIYTAVKMGRIGVGVELKPSYYRQALQNIELAMQEDVGGQDRLFDMDDEPEFEDRDDE